MPGRTGPSGPGRYSVLAAPAAAEVVRVGRYRAEYRVRPGLPVARHLALVAPGHRRHPPGVEAYAAYALRARLARDRSIRSRTRRFAQRPAIFSFSLSMPGRSPAT